MNDEGEKMFFIMTQAGLPNDVGKEEMDDNYTIS